ncbi:NADP-dependent oxidoreductase [Neptunitalea lumnitzerae]|uniref:Quinone oxidoreductase n=1 Tax=Neptunitalea lumnitzerae TaxID=2965509 RepID=A0ABQ5MG66_9FLAO|nr:NADP-dependent oxidoreductase [Neptunitalea sp. Y10]GLB48389.1 quinone oxidoreductase [Neptunitalea sp. Y10]
MRAVSINEFGSINNLQITNIDTPSPNDNEIILKVEAIGINPVDAKAREGNAFAAKLPKVNFPVILGKDVAGIVVKKGKKITSYNVGDHVFGIASNGSGFGETYAEYTKTSIDALVPIPRQVSFTDAASSPVAALTAIQALKETIDLSPTDHILIHAGAGGVGHFAIQYAKYIGATVTASSSLENKDFILNTLGADAHIDYENVDYKEYESKFDVVLDLVGLTNIDNAILTTKPGGDVICIPSNSFDLFKQKLKDKDVNGHTLLMHPDKEWMHYLSHLLKEEILVPYISNTYGLEDMQEVHKKIESGKTRGKLVVVP